MGVEIVVAAVSAVAGVVGTVKSISDARGAKRQQKKAQNLQRASQAAQAAQERRQQIREERIKRARVLQAAENTGSAGSSGEFGAISSLGTQLGSNLGFNASQQDIGNRITDANQKASDLSFSSQVAGQLGNQFLNFSGDTFNVGGGFDIFKSNTPGAVSDYTKPQRSSD